MTGRIVKSDDMDGKGHACFRMTALIVLAGALFAIVANSSFLSEINGGKEDLHISIEVKAVSGVHQGLFTVEMPDGDLRAVDLRRWSSTGYVAGLNKGGGLILVFLSKEELEGSTLYPHYAELIRHDEMKKKDY